MSPPADHLTAAEQQRGRRLAYASHPFGMTYRTALVGDLATQALVTLGASARAVGAQAGLVGAAALVQLPALALLERTSKRRLLLSMQLVALLTALPLLAFDWLRGLGAALAVPVALATLALTTLALTAGSTAWWPLLHGFVPPERTGRFFAALRSLWHVMLIAFFLGCRAWLAEHPGGFGALFAVAWGCGLARVLLLLFFPERREQRVLGAGEAARHIRAAPALRRYLRGVTLNEVVYRALPPFTILLLRRDAGLSEAQVLALTLATFVGGFLALVPAGRLSDRFGAGPVLLATCVLRGALIAGLALAVATLQGAPLLAACASLFLGWSFLQSAFGVAEVKVLFALAGDSPSGVIVVSVVFRSVVAGLCALGSGALLALLRDAGVPTLPLYVGFFLLLAALQALAALPLRRS
ncbi:MAG: MFS transporter [Planctomycetota bacterium]